MKALLVATPSDDWRGIIKAGFYTGQRLGDLANLCWKQTDLNAEVITIDRQMKTGVGVAIPIHPDLLDHFLKLEIPSDQTIPIFPSLHGKSGSGKSGPSH